MAVRRCLKGAFAGFLKVGLYSKMQIGIDFSQVMCNHYRINWS